MKKLTLLLTLSLFASSAFAQEAAATQQNVDASPQETAVAQQNAADALPTPPRIAVYITGTPSDVLKNTLGSRILASLVKTGRYGSIERPNDFLAEVANSPDSLQETADDRRRRVIELAKTFGARYVCAASMTIVSDEFQILARIIDVETAKIIHIGEASNQLKTASDFEVISDKIVSSIFNTTPNVEPDTVTIVHQDTAQIVQQDTVAQNSLVNEQQGIQIVHQDTVVNEQQEIQIVHQPPAVTAQQDTQIVQQYTIATAPVPTAQSLTTTDLPRIAVYITGNISENEKHALGTTMLSALVYSGRYSGIERSSLFLAEVEKEHVRQRSGAIDDNQISELGKQFGVKYICVAAITPAFGEFQVSARIINVETAEVVYIASAFNRLRTSGDFNKVSSDVVRRMLGIDTAADIAAREARRRSRLKLTIRIPSATLAVGGIVGGIVMDGVMMSETARYRDFGDPQNPRGTDAENFAKVRTMRKNIDNSLIARNVFYAIAGVGAAGFAVTLFF